MHKKRILSYFARKFIHNKVLQQFDYEMFSWMEKLKYAIKTSTPVQSSRILFGLLKSGESPYL